jgi:hypothetical protein
MQESGSMTLVLDDVDILPADPAINLPEVGRCADLVIGRPGNVSPSASDDEDELEPEEEPAAPIGDFDDFDEEDFDDEFDDDFEGELEDEYQLSEFEEVTEEDLLEPEIDLPITGDLIDEDAEEEPEEPLEEPQEEEPPAKGKKGKGKETKGKKGKVKEEEDEDDEDDFDDDDDE